MTDTKHHIIRCSFNTENALYHAYMPFVNDGGLFIRMKPDYELGTQIKLKVRFLDEPEEHIVDGQIVWITPQGAQGNKPAGIGVQFVGENKQQVSNKIETLLAGKLKSTQSTDTM